MTQSDKQKSITENKVSNSLPYKGNMRSPLKHYDVHTLTVNEIATLFQTSIQNGLTEEEIDKRHAAFGYNRLTAKKEKTITQILLQQFTSVAVYLLLAAAFISFILNDVAEAIAILIVIILNAVVGFIMEWQALASLKCFVMILVCYNIYP